MPANVIYGTGAPPPRNELYIWIDTSKQQKKQSYDFPFLLALVLWISFVCVCVEARDAICVTCSMQQQHKKHDGNEK